MIYFHGKMKEIEIEGLTISSFENDLKLYNYYNFEIRFSTPFRYYTREEMDTFMANFDSIFNFLSLAGDEWEIVQEDKSSHSGPVWYNSCDVLEEIYVHPAELSGSLRLSHLICLINYIKEKDFETTKIYSVDVYNKVEYHTFKEMYELFNKNLSKILADEERKAEIEKYYKIAGYNLEDFELDLKMCRFASTSYNKEIDETINFFWKVVRTYLR